MAKYQRLLHKAVGSILLMLKIIVISHKTDPCSGSSAQHLGKTFKGLMAVSTACSMLLVKQIRPGHQTAFPIPADVSYE
jgi:hypothetical protein